MSPKKTKARGRIANDFHVSYPHVQNQLYDLMQVCT
jgi:hypothetical protein